jgi:Ser/Thr protein kinase RdoA (MazF antagonist)
MDRKILMTQYKEKILNHAVERFKLDAENIAQFDAYEGCANLVFACKRKGQPVILRVSYRPERTYDQILAEIHFIQYLSENGVRVSNPLASDRGKFVEDLSIAGTPIYLVCFEKGIGMRVPDNNYRYRDDAPIDEYFQNWGAILGKMHACAKRYQPMDPQIQRPDWFRLHHQKLNIDSMIPDEHPLVREHLHALLNEIRSLPKDQESYGLIHGDFNDGNFTVDYSNGNITVFDFDDSCYFWFVYELAAAWEGGIGRVMFNELQARKDFMRKYMDQIFFGYSRENHLPEQWKEKIPLFIKLIQAEELLHYSQYIQTDDTGMQSHLRYLIKCIELDLPYMGFFDPIYSPEKPFSL